MKTALIGRELISAITNKNVEAYTNEKSLSVIVPALGDKPLRAVQDCETAREIWGRLQEQNAGKTLLNKLEILNNLLNMNYNAEQIMEDHVAVFDSQCELLASMAPNYMIR